MTLAGLDGIQPGKAALEAIKAHPTLAEFASPDFDPASFAAKVVIQDTSHGTPHTGRSRAELVVQEVALYLERIHEAIEKHVVQHQHQLMQSIGDLGELRENCDVLTIRSKELCRSVDKLKGELLEPYQSTELRTRQLGRVHEANDLLKRVARFSQTMARLRKGRALDEPSAAKTLDLRELAKAAGHIVELEGLLQDANLGQLSLVQRDKGYLTDLSRVVRQTAKDSLKQALKTMNQADLGPALQVFYNLQCLAPIVMEAMQTIIQEALEATKRAVASQALDRVANADAPAAAGEGARATSPPTDGTTANPPADRKKLTEMEAIAVRQRRARFRDHADKWAAALYEASIKVWHLQRVLLKKIDPTTNEQYLDVVLRSDVFNNSKNSRGRDPRFAVPVGALYWKYWTDLSASIAKLASASVTKNPSGAVVKCYPFFCLALLGVLSRLLDNTSKQRAGFGMAQSYSIAQGNPLAMRALMEALDPTGEDSQDGEETPSLPAAAKTEAAGGEVGATVEERDALLDSLASIRDQYLADSLERLCRPVEDMFPQKDGYQAAVPSKHDLQSFVKVLSNELTTGLAEGGPMLVPHLVHGTAKAAKLFCNKAESMLNTSESATKLYPLRGWPMTTEREHNVQILNLLAALYTALRRVPKDLQTVAEEFVGGSVGSGSLGAAELEQACGVVEELAVTIVVRPYLVNIAVELGGILAEMHLENYAPKDDATRGDEECSRFVSAFQDALSAIRRNHLNRFPNVPFVQRGVKWLTARLLRTYVSHAALIRPLNQRGKVKLNRDTAMIETTLSGLTKVSGLGGAYHELRAFRELCFYGDDCNPVTVNGLMKESFTPHLRPSTLLDFLFTRAPPELSSPHVMQRCSERTLVEELLALYFDDGDTQAAAEQSQDADDQELQQATDSRLAAEQAHWQLVQVCLDAYAQRMSAAKADLAYTYDLLLNLGELVLKHFVDQIRGSKKPQWARLDVV